MENELFIKSPTKETFDDNKNTINEDAVVFINGEGEQSIIAKGVRYRCAPKGGNDRDILRYYNGKLFFADKNWTPPIENNLNYV